NSPTCAPTRSAMWPKSPKTVWTGSVATLHCVSRFSATLVFVYESSAGYFTILFKKTTIRFRVGAQTLYVDADRPSDRAAHRRVLRSDLLFLRARLSQELPR